MFRRGSDDKKNSKIELYKNDDDCIPSITPCPEVDAISCTTTSQPENYTTTVLPDEDKNRG